jgi:hypothetical protein
MFKKKNIIKFLFFYIASKFILLLLIPIASSNIFQIFNLENSGNPDLVFNDLYFRARNKDCLSNEHYKRPKSVVLINSGSLNPDSFRLELASVLYKLKLTEARAIGIDHDFFKTDKIGTASLKNEIESNSKIVYSYRSNKDDGSKDSSFIDFKATKGDTRLPDTYSIRRYYEHENTFGASLVKIAYPDKAKQIVKNEGIFNINYSSTGSGVINCHPDSSFENKYWDVNFKSIEAASFLYDTTLSDFFKEEIKNKIVIIGHLGTAFYDNAYDVQDKFAVPIDPDRIMLREKTMHGAVIHANAIENILHPESKFFEIKGFLDFFLHELLFILFMILLFQHYGKLANITILIGISIPYVIVVLKLMEYHIYITMTSTLLSLLFAEEFFEIIEPIYNKFAKKFKLVKDEVSN